MIRNSPNSTADARNRMLNRLAAKMDKVVGHRGDLYIADFQRVDPDGGKLLLGYEKSVGPVGANDVVAFVSRCFDGNLQPLMESAKQYKAEGAVSLMVRRTVPTRKLEDKRSMLAISNTHFLDQQLGDTWEVKAHEDGSKYLARISRDDIGAIVSERRRRMAVQASTVTFGNTLSAGIPNISRGDEVRFYEGGRMLDGKVTRVGTADVSITAGGTSYTVAHEAVAEILQASPQTQENVRSYLQDYFADAYGFEQYASELTDRLA
jgi:hypothetical protein